MGGFAEPPAPVTRKRVRLWHETRFPRTPVDKLRDFGSVASLIRCPHA